MIGNRAINSPATYSPRNEIEPTAHSMTVAPMQCPRCAGPFQIESSSAGLQVGCPHCGQPVQIPPLSEWGQPEQPPPPPEASPVEPPPHEPPIKTTAAPPPAPSPNVAPQPSSGADAFSLNCPHCQGEFQVTSAMSGTAVACPLCQQALQLPDFASGQPAQPPSTPYQAPSGLSPQEAAFWRMPTAAGQGSGPQPSATSGPSASDSKGDAPNKKEAPSDPSSKRAAPSTYQYPPGMEPKEVGTRPADDRAAKPLTDTVADIDPMLPPGATKPKAEQSKSQAADPMMPPSVEEKSKPDQKPAEKSPTKQEEKQSKTSSFDAMLPPTAKPAADESKPDSKQVDDAPKDEAPKEKLKPKSPTASDPKIDSLLPPSATMPSGPADDAATSAADISDAAPTTEQSAEVGTEPKPTDDDPKPSKEAKLDSLLPPTASKQEPAADESESSDESPQEETRQKSAKDAKLDSLLPPTAPATSQPAGPTIEEPPDWKPAAQQNMPEGSILIPTEDGSYAQVREPRRTVGYGEDEVELRQLTPAEKAWRRLIRNVVMWVIGTLILSGAMYLLTTGMLF